jgi:hypothetical protein
MDLNNEFLNAATTHTTTTTTTRSEDLEYLQ